MNRDTALFDAETGKDVMSPQQLFSFLVSPLNVADKSLTEALEVIHSSVTTAQWYQLLQTRGDRHNTILQLAAERRHIVVMKFIKDTVTAQQWYQLLDTHNWSVQLFGQVFDQRRWTLKMNGTVPEMEFYRNSVTADQWNNLGNIIHGMSCTPLTHLVFESKCLEMVMLIKDSVTADQWYSLLQIQDRFSDTPLHLAVQKGDQEIVELIKLYVTGDQWYNLLQIQNDSSGTTLHQAFAGKSREMVNLIKDSVNADQWYSLLQIQNKQQGTPLQQAVSGNSQEIVELIKDTVNADQWYSLLQIQNKQQGTPLHQAVSGNSQEIVELIKDTVNADQWYSLLQIQNKQQGTPLQQAVSGNSLEMVELIKDSAIADQWYNLLQIQNDSSGTTLHQAFAGKSREMVNLIKDSVNADQWYSLLRIQNKQQGTPLQQAVTGNSLEMVELIKDSVNADQWYNILQTRDKSGTPLHLALSRVDEEMAEPKRVTLTAYTTGNLLPMENGSSCTALHQAVENKCLEMVKFIKDSVNEKQWYNLLQKQNQSSGTPLHMAVSVSSQEMVKLIKDTVNADRWYSLLQIRHGLFDTPLCLAVMRVDQEIAELIKMTVTTDQWYELTLPVVESRLIVDTLENRGLEVIRYMLVSLTATQQAATIRNLTTNGTVPNFLTKIMRDDIIENKVWIDLLSTPLSDAVRATFYLLLRKKSTSDLVDLAIATADQTGNTCYDLAEQNFLLHVLAQNGDICRIKQLMYRLSDKQRAHLVRMEDAHKKIPYQLSSSPAVKTLLQWTEAQEGFYLLPTPPAVLILYNTEEREGAQEEYEQLNKVLPRFNVNTTVKKDLTRKGIMLAIREAQEETVTLSALMVIIMSHGHRGAVQTSDGPLNIKQILLTMNSSKLDGKPKVLLIQACQNNSTHSPEVPSYNYDSLCQGTEQPGALKNYDARSSNVTDTHFDIQYADTMVLMATVNGSRAERNMMIPLFADNLSRSGEHEDLYEVFLKTNRDIRAQSPSQVAEFRSTLQYKLSLRNVFDPDGQYKLSLMERMAKFFGLA